MYFSLFECTVPGEVTGVSLSKAVGSRGPALIVTWDSPQSSVTITRYEVQYTKGETDRWKDAPAITGSPPLTTTHLEGLQAGTSYSVRVRAVAANSEEGEWSDDEEETTFDSEFRDDFDSTAHKAIKPADRDTVLLLKQMYLGQKVH